MFVRENNAVELLRRDPALLQTQHDLASTQTAINENLAVVGGDQRAVPRAPAAEHGQAEHGFQDSRVISVCANGNSENDERYRKHICSHSTDFCRFRFIAAWQPFLPRGLWR